MPSKIDCMKRRVSVRTYAPTGLTSDEKNTIEGIARANSSGPFGCNVRIEVVDAGAAAGAEAKKFGTYGFIRGAQFFIAGVVQDSPQAFLDFGYCFEKTVLEVTDMNLGSCWMALTYNAKGFLEKVKLGPNEALAVVAPVGTPSPARSIIDRLVRFVARPRRRKPWTGMFFDTAIPVALSPQSAGKYAAALECVRLAPSASNCQPWRIVKASSADVFHFFAVRKGARTSGELHVGIAMCHFELAARELGCAGSWQALTGIPQAEGLDYFVSWVGA
jgi:hypothetical protein